MKYEVSLVLEVEADGYGQAALGAVQLLGDRGITRFTVTPMDYYRDGRLRHRMSKAKIVELVTWGLMHGI